MSSGTDLTETIHEMVRKIVERIDDGTLSTSPDNDDPMRQLITVDRCIEWVFGEAWLGPLPKETARVMERQIKERLCGVRRSEKNLKALLEEEGIQTVPVTKEFVGGVTSGNINLRAGQETLLGKEGSPRISEVRKYIVGVGASNERAEALLLTFVGLDAEGARDPFLEAWLTHEKDQTVGLVEKTAVDHKAARKSLGPLRETLQARLSEPEPEPRLEPESA